MTYSQNLIALSMMIGVAEAFYCQQITAAGALGVLAILGWSFALFGTRKQESK